MIYFVGLDLGQAQDYTALSIVEAHPTIKKYRVSDYDPIREIECLPLSFDVSYLKRYALGTSYPAIVEDVSQKVRQLNKRVFTIDQTGVGRPVFDLFEGAGLKPLGITITGSDIVHGEGRQWRVPKRDLVGILQVAVQAGRLKVAKKLPEAKTLVDEFLNFRVKINLKTAHDSYEAWREGVHDDLVLSVALACWTAEWYYRNLEIVAHQDEAQKKLDQELDELFQELDL
jgi:hypothetical protein